MKVLFTCYSFFFTEWTLQTSGIGGERHEPKLEPDKQTNWTTRSWTKASSKGNEGGQRTCRFCSFSGGLYRLGSQTKPNGAETYRNKTYRDKTYRDKTYQDKTYQDITYQRTKPIETKTIGGLNLSADETYRLDKTKQQTKPIETKPIGGRNYRWDKTYWRDKT